MVYVDGAEGVLGLDSDVWRIGFGRKSMSSSSMLISKMALLGEESASIAGEEEGYLAEVVDRSTGGGDSAPLGEEGIKAAASTEGMDVAVCTRVGVCDERKLVSRGGGERSGDLKDHH